MNTEWNADFICVRPRPIKWIEMLFRAGLMMVDPVASLLGGAGGTHE